MASYMTFELDTSYMFLVQKGHVFVARKHRRISSMERGIDVLRHGDKVGTADVQFIGRFSGVSPLRKFVKDSGFKTEWEWARLIEKISPYKCLSYNIYYASNFDPKIKRGVIHIERPM